MFDETVNKKRTLEQVDRKLWLVFDRKLLENLPQGTVISDNKICDFVFVDSTINCQ